MARKRAFTLLETLFALGITMLLILNFTTLLKGISKMHFPKNQNDVAYAIIAITEEVNMAHQVDVMESHLILETASHTYQFYVNQKRLVRSPGFNIYLHQIDAVHFEKENDDVYMILERGDNIERYQIGTAFRPQKRLCQSADVSDAELFSEFDSTIDPNNSTRNEVSDSTEAHD